MPLKEAVRLVRFEKKDVELQIHLIPLSREVTIRCNTSDIACLEKIFLIKEYQMPFPTNPQIIVDAGANIGLATLYYSQEYPNAKIIAIEPERSNFNLLKKNCADLPNITLVEGALWNREGTLIIQDPKAEKWKFSVTEPLPTSSSTTEEVQAMTIPGILRQIGTDRIDILKLDIEGSEYELFKNGAEDWLGAVDQIVIELHDRFRSGSAHAFYAAISRMSFVQENRGENIFIKLGDQSAGLP
ncbi:MAG: FkbM family methyltransferase [Methylacidiphilales bacterium]|nr:FkbM family methyltransferase [Candidatus Methylacidiphilales bacterium]